MASTPIQIVNLALAKIGEPPILALDAAQRTAELANIFYSTVRDDVLRAHPWNCAKARRTLARTDAPAFGFTYAYALPADCLRIVRVNEDKRSFFRLEGGTILSDDTALELLYIRRIPEALMDALLVSTLVAFLAAEMAEPLTGSDTKTDRLRNEGLAKLADARTVNAMEGPTEELGADQWIESRFSSTDPFRKIESA